MKESKDIQTLLHRISKSDASAFREIFSIYSNQVYSFAYTLSRDRITAEEMVQEVFLKLWVNRENVSTIENLSSYLFIITRNLVLNTLKRKALEEKAKAIFIAEAEKVRSETEEQVIHADIERVLNDTVSHLPPQQRLIYSMCHQEGLQYNEVAQKLKISPLTVKTHMHQALKKIRAQISTIL